MKKILLILSMCFVSWSAQSAQMCAENDAVIIPYGTGVGTNYNYWPSVANSGTTWTVNSYYGMMTGVTACLSSNESTGTYAMNASVSAKGGEQAGKYCWCKMLHPVSSYWVYFGDVGTMTSCVSACATNCASMVNSNANARSNMLSAATN